MNIKLNTRGVIAELVIVVEDVCLKKELAYPKRIDNKTIWQIEENFINELLDVILEAANFNESHFEIFKYFIDNSYSCDIDKIKEYLQSKAVE